MIIKEKCMETQILSPAASQVHNQTMRQNTSNTGTGGSVRKRLCGVLAAALLAAAGCDGSGGNGGGGYYGGGTTKFTDSRLRGM
jgi:hypothetical protein